jgi:glycosyltransferase involved in cell wall biosynthesis
MNLKFLLIFAYYQRPKIARWGMESILNQTYSNFEVVFIDDSEDFQPGFDLFQDMVGADPRFKYVHTGDTTANKLARGGGIFGRFMNEAMEQSDADIVIIICDDDSIMPDYLEKLNRFYLDNPHIQTSYCDVVVYNALTDDWREKIKETVPSNHFLNTNKLPHNMNCSKDSCQGSWRLDLVRNNPGLRYPWPLTHALDSRMYEMLFQLTGPAYPNDILGALKQYSEINLGHHGGYDRVD